jgi:iron complex transport system permease protein
MEKVNSLSLPVKKTFTPIQRIGLLAALSVLSIILYMTINLGSNLAYILPHRGYIVLTMIIVAFGSGVSTVLFQTIANNKILTPSIMGLEALFILLQTIFVFYTDSFPASWLLNIGKFLLESSLLVIFSVLLYRWLFISVKMNINLVLMVGIILGTLFRSVATLLQRLMDPNEFSILQSRMFATFTKGTPELILFTLVITVIVGILLWRMRYCFDVLALGQANAVN